MSCPLFPRNLHFPALRSGHRLFQRPSPPKQIPSNHLARQFCLGLVGAALVCGLSSAALAQSRWNGNVDGDWDTATNWDAPPINGSDLIFDGFYNKTNTNNLLAEIGLLTLTGSDWNITAGTLALNAGITASGTSTVNGTFTLGAAQTFQNSTGTLTVSGTVANGGNLLTVGGLGNTLLSAAVSGTGGLTKSGSGTLTLSANTTYTGNTSVNEGTLKLGGLSASPAFAIASGAVLELVPTANYTTSTTFSGSGTLRKSGSVSARWDAAAATFALDSGSLIDVQEGTFVGGAGANEVWTNNKSNLNVAAGAIFNGVEANVRVNALTGAGTIRSGFNGAGYESFTFGVDNGSGTFDGVLENNIAIVGSYTKAGTGTQILTGNNTYTGTTTISGGTLQVGNGGTTGSLASASVVNNATLAFNRSDNSTFGGAISGSGHMTKLGTGTLAITGNATHSGGTTISAGTLQIGNGGTTGSISGDVINDAALHFFRSDDFTYNGNIDGTGSLTKLGVGTLTMGGYYTFTGNTTVSEGILSLTNAIYDRGAIAGTLSIQSGATLDLQAQDIFGYFFYDSSARVVVEAGGLVTNGNFYNTFTNLTLNGGELRASGGYSADWTAYKLKGTVIVGGTSASSITTTGAPNSQIQLGDNTVGGFTTFDVANASGDSAADLTISAELQNSRNSGGNTVQTGLNKTGDGTLLLTGNNTYTGTTTISGGLLQIGNGGTSGSVAGNISLASGTGVHFDRSDDLTYNGNIDGAGSLNKLGAGTLAITGDATHSGGTTISAGTLQIGNGGTTGSISGDVTNNAALHFFRSDAVTYYGDVSGTGSVTNLGSGTLTLGGNATHSGGTTISAGTLQIGNGGTTGSISGDVTNNATLHFFRSDDFTYNGNIDGTGSLTKLGSGTLTMGGYHTFTGDTTVSEGTLSLTNAIYDRGAIAGTLSVQSGATLDLQAQEIFGVFSSHFLDINARVVIEAGGLVTNGNFYNPLINLTLNGGELRASGGHSAQWAAYQLVGTVSVGGTSSSSITTTGVPNSQIHIGNGYWGGYTIFDVADATGDSAADLTISAELQNSPIDWLEEGLPSGLHKTGDGTLVLTGNNTYTDYTYIFGGILQIGNGGTSGSVAGPYIFMDSGTAIHFNRSDAFTYNGYIDGAGSLTKLGDGTLTLGGILALTGPTTLSEGTLRLTGSYLNWSSSPSSLFVQSGTTLDLQAQDIFDFDPYYSYVGVVIEAGGLVTNGNFYNMLTDLTLNGGELRASGGHSADLPAYQLKGTVSVGGTSASSITTTGAPNSQIQLGDNTSGGFTTFDVADATGDSAADLTISAELQNGRDIAEETVSSGLTKSGNGTLLLTGNNTYTGETTISGGILQIGNGGTSGSVAGNISLDSGTAVHFNRSDALTYNGNIDGAGSLTKLGAGTLAITGDATHSGGTTVSAGTLQIGNGGTTGSISGDVTNNAALHFFRSDDFTYNGNIDGTGSLTKLGTGTLTLSGANTYSNGTTIHAGTLIVTHNQAVGTGAVMVEGGSFFVETGVTITNEIILSGGSYLRSLGAEANLAGAIDASSSFAGGRPDTTAEILQGTLSEQGTLESSFQDHSSALNDAIRLSDVYSLHGTGNSQFVLQLSITGLTADNYLGWLDTDTGSTTYNQWVNAIDGNSGGTPTFFARGYNAATDFHLGYYGIDMTTGSVWAVLNHNSDFAVIPEPGTAALLMLGLGTLYLRRRMAR